MATNYPSLSRLCYPLMWHSICKKRTSLKVAAVILADKICNANYLALICGLTPKHYPTKSRLRHITFCAIKPFTNYCAVGGSSVISESTNSVTTKNGDQDGSLISLPAVSGRLYFTLPSSDITANMPLPKFCVA